ncbi:MAG: DMT family transporter [Pseudomonadota bacterium]
MKPKAQIDAFGAVVLVSFSVLLGLNQVGVKLVNEALSPTAQAGWRSIAAFLPVLAFALFMRRRLDWRDGTLPWGLLAGVLFAGEFLLLFLALEVSNVARVSLLFYTMPVFVALGAHWLVPGERLTGRRAIGLALAVVGVALCMSGGHSGRSASLLGDVFSLAAAACWAAMALMLRITPLSKASAEMNLLYQLAVSGVLLAAVAALTGDVLREPTPFLWGIFALQVIFVVCVGFLTWIWLISIYPVAQVTSFSLLTPLFGVLFGVLIFDDPIGPAFLLALALVLGGLALINTPPKAASGGSSEALPE